MGFSSTKFRLRSVWLLVPIYLILARPTPGWIAIGVVLAVLGGLVRAWAAGTIHKNAVLTTGGPYAHTRNPLYVGTFLVGAGLVVASGSLILIALFAVFFAIIYGRTMKAEELNLESLFGEQYRAYAAAVPLFIPRIRPYRPAEPHPTRFELRRYLRNREWELALGVAAGFIALVVKMLVT